MLALTLAEIAAACGGRLEGGDPRVVIGAVCTDSRRLAAGQLFVGLRGESYDGDAYAAQALAGGAAAVMVRAATAATLPGDVARIVVDDGLSALQALATEVRRRAAVKVVAITGSAGKTSTKDILAALLRPVARTVATAANLNNEIGVPLTLLDIEQGTEVVVVEMAMRGRGQIRQLARVALPDIGVITNIAPVHLELVGTVDDVASAKAELIEELRGGTAVVPDPEPLLDRHVGRFRGRVVTFGGPEADVHLVATEQRGAGTHVLVDAFGHRGTLDFSFTGGHYLQDALAALSAFMELGYRLDEAREGAARVAFSDLRGAVPGFVQPVAQLHEGGQRGQGVLKIVAAGEAEVEGAPVTERVDEDMGGVAARLRRHEVHVGLRPAESDDAAAEAAHVSIEEWFRVRDHGRSPM